MTATRNLGQVSAIFIGVSPPTNTTLIWYDTSLAAPLHKYYDTTTSTWVLFNTTPSEDNYRLNSYSINNTTTVVFSSELSSNNYEVEVISFTSSSGISIQAGWTIANEFKTTSGFRFTPPSRYLVGTLKYKATLIK